MTKTPHSALTKICHSCGQEKSLSAFLQLSDKGALVYGHLCSACRKTDKTKSISPNDDSSASETGHRIDSKTKVKSDTDKQLLRESLKESDELERTEEDNIKETLQEKKQALAKKERQHREGYLKHKSFLNASRTKENTTITTIQLTHEEDIKTRVDHTKPDENRIAGKISRNSAVYHSLKTWLGTSAPITDNITKMKLLEKQNTPSQPGPGTKKR